MVHPIVRNLAFRIMAEQRRFRIGDLNIGIDMDNMQRPEPRPRTAQRALFGDRGAEPNRGIDTLNAQMLECAGVPPPPLPNRVRTLREENNNINIEREGPKLCTSHEIVAMEERLRNELARMEGRLKQHQARCANSVLDVIAKRLQGIEEVIGNSLANSESTANKHFSKLDKNDADHKDMLEKSVEAIGNLVQNTMISQIRFQVNENPQNKE